MCVHKFISFCVELKSVRLIRGLPWGDSSLVKYTVAGVDVAAVRGYPAVTVVELGVIIYIYPP